MRLDRGSEVRAVEGGSRGPSRPGGDRGMLMRREVESEVGDLYLSICLSLEMSGQSRVSCRVAAVTHMLKFTFSR